MCTEQCHKPLVCTCFRVAYLLVDIGRSLYGSKGDGGGCINSKRSDGSCALSRACLLIVLLFVDVIMQ